MDFMDELNRITKIDPENLTKEEIGFLRARQSYLAPEQKVVYKEILEVKKPKKTKKKK